MDHQKALEPWRKEIRDIDEQIMQLVARRMELAVQIGEYKKSHNLPIKDFTVEKQIIERSHSLAHTMKLDVRLTENIMKCLIEHSVQQQNRLSPHSSPSSERSYKKGLIVGGFGRMGRWFSQYFQSLGFEIWVHDIQKDSNSHALRQPENLHADLKTNLDEYEFILLATPHGSTVKLLLELAETCYQGLIFEISSLKNPLQKAFASLSAKGLKIASVHPMFGPDTETLAEKNILFCSGEGLHSEEVLKRYFKDTSAKLITLPLVEHDRKMAVVLGFAHFFNLIYGMTLAEKSIAAAELCDVAGPTFLQQLEVTRTVFGENLDLYYDLQADNTFSTELAASLLAAFRELEGWIRAGQKQLFMKKMAEVKNFLAR